MRKLLLTFAALVGIAAADQAALAGTLNLTGVSPADDTPDIGEGAGLTVNGVFFSGYSPSAGGAVDSSYDDMAGWVFLPDGASGTPLTFAIYSPTTQSLDYADANFNDQTVTLVGGKVTEVTVDPLDFGSQPEVWFDWYGMGHGYTIETVSGDAIQDFSVSGATDVPEGSTLALAAIGLAVVGAAGVYRRREAQGLTAAA